MTFRVMVLMVSAFLLSGTAYAEEVSREQIKGLDEQVQEIKSDVLAIEAELSLLEEKLLYPSDTQVALFVSLAGGAGIRLDAVQVELAGRPVAQHLYTFKELEALQKGGVQRIHTGNLQTGDHELRVTVVGKTAGGADFRQTESFTVRKDIGPKIVEIAIAGPTISLKDR